MQWTSLASLLFDEPGKTYRYDQAFKKVWDPQNSNGLSDLGVLRFQNGFNHYHLGRISIRFC